MPSVAEWTRAEQAGIRPVEAHIHENGSALNGLPRASKQDGRRGPMRNLRRNVWKLAQGIVTGTLVLACSVPMLAGADTLASNAPDQAIFGTPAKTAIACNWRVANGTPDATTRPGALRWGYLDLAAGYWQVILSPSFAAGTRFRFEGQFPAARNFSYQLYNGGSEELAALPDYQVVPDSGSRSPFNGVNTLDTAIHPGGRYTAYLVYSPKPAHPAANTIYLDPKQVTTGNQVVLVYRVYNAFSGITVAQHGGMPLPAVYEETAQGDVPLASIDTTLICNLGIGARDTERRTFSAASDIYNGLPKRPGAIPAKPVPAAPAFLLRDSASDILVNSDNRYIYAQLSQTLGDVARQNREKEKFRTRPAKKVVTNEDIPESSTLSPSDKATAAATSVPAAPAPKSAREWRIEIAAQEDRVEKLQAHIEKLSESIHFVTANAYVHGAEYNQYQMKKQQEVKNLQKQLNEEQKKLSDLQEAARKEGMGGAVYEP